MKMNGNEKYFSEYMQDCMLGAIPSGLKFLDKLRNASIIISSMFDGGLVKYLLLFFQFLNDSYHLKMKIHFCCIQQGNELKDCPLQADILIHTGICNQDMEGIGDCYTLFENSFVKLCEKLHPRKILLLTDYRVMARNLCAHTALAEREANVCGTELCGGNAAAVQGAFETICACAAHQYQGEYYILRTGALLGPELMGCADIQRILNANKTQESVDDAGDVVPYLYISDFLQAVLIVLLEGEPNEVYHGISPEMTLSGYEALGLLYRLFGTKAPVTDTKRDGVNYAMAGAKLQLKGFQPQMDMKQSVVVLHQYLKGEETPAYDVLYEGKIRKIQRLVLRALTEVDTICRRHQIPYALGGGTLLGAVRHKGFIPWDEDADLIMERNAYEKFLKAAEAELPEWLFLQTPKTDKNNHFYTKIRVTDTILSTEFTSRIPGLHQGVFVDIFCHDKTSKYKLMQKVHINAVIVARSMVFNKWGNTKIAGKDGGYMLLRMIFTGIKNMLPMSVLERFQFWLITCYKNRSTGYLFDGMGQNVRNGAFPQAWLKDTVLAQFETEQFPIPKEYDKYLTYLYGAYQEMIPMRKRFDDSYAKQVDLGKYFWE